jgi:hypothetical protein
MAYKKRVPVKTYATDFFKPFSKRIFVFGSNQHGHHGAGAAKWALDHAGAVYGQPFGGQGQSFAIPTKNYEMEPLPVYHIKWSVEALLNEALLRPELTFYVTPIGCGLARHSPAEIGPLFAGHAPNIILPPEFK